MLPFPIMNVYGNVKEKPVIVKLVSGEYHMMLLDSTGTLWGSGDGGTYSSFGTSSANGAFFGQWVKVIEGISDVWCNSNWTIIKKNDGSIWYCGTNGISTSTVANFTRLTSSQLGTVQESDIKDIYGSKFIIHFVLKNNRVYAIGTNIFGNSGLGTTALSTLTRVSSLPTVSSIKYIKYCDNGNGTVFVLFDNNTLYGFGRNSYGEMGIGNSTIQNTAVLLKSSVQMVTTSGTSSTILQNGVLYSAGQQYYGSLGNGASATPSVYIKTYTSIPYSSNAYEPLKVLGHFNPGLTNAFINSDGIWYTGNYAYVYGAPDQSTVLSYTNISSPVPVDNIVGYGALYFSSFISTGTELYQCGQGRYIIGNGVNGTYQYGYIKVPLPWDV